MTVPLVIGLGSFHGDDQAGWLVLSHLRQLGYPSSRLIQAHHAASILDACDIETALVICDACLAQVHPGTIHSIDGASDSFFYERPFSSHDLSVAETIQLLLRISDTVPRIHLWAIEGSRWDAETLASPEVESAAQQVAQSIYDTNCKSR